MLENIPGMASHFGFDWETEQFKEKMVRENERFHAHSQLITIVLNSIVELLDHPIHMIDVMHEVAINHIRRKRPVGIQYFGVLKEKFHLHIAGVLNIDTDSREAILWQELMSVFCDVIEEEELTKKDILPCCSLS